MCFAATYGREKIVEFLLQKGRLDDQLYEPFQAACRSGRVSIVKQLLQDPRLKLENWPQCGFPDACINRESEIVQMLLQDPRTVVPAEVIVYARGANVIRVLLSDPRVDPSIQSNEAVRLAAYGGDLESVKLLLQDPRVCPTSEAFEGACSSGYTEIVSLLLNDTRLNPMDRSHEALRLAVKFHQTEVVKLIARNERARSLIDSSEMLEWAYNASAHGEDEIAHELVEALLSLCTPESLENTRNIIDRFMKFGEISDFKLLIKELDLFEMVRFGNY